MTLALARRIDRIEVVYPNPTLQVRYIDTIIDTDNDNAEIAVKGYHRETYSVSGDLSNAPIQIQAAAAAMAAFQQANPDSDAIVDIE